MSDIETSSIASSESSDVENLILDQPMYYVLNQFLVTEEGKNVATCMDELRAEITELKQLLKTFLSSQKPTAECRCP